MLQIVNLQIGNGGVARIDLVTFGHHGLGKIFGPAAFVFVYLSQGRAQVGIGDFAFGIFQHAQQVVYAFIGAVFIPQISAEEIISEKKPVGHHLQADGLDGLHVGQGVADRGARVVFAAHGENVHDE